MDEQKMSEQDRKYFEELSEGRKKIADALEEPCIAGVKNVVVDQYTDKAHFIYELLQNADDAHATEARFILEPEKLIFVHNGTERFSVTDPALEGDPAAGKLGHINAITSIGNSNKTEAKIGKFGIGFKSVFQYTSGPVIYDPKFRFKIERFIVPESLPEGEDYPGRGPEETLFVFPFDDPKSAYNDIADKLKSLSFPLLFLSEHEQNIKLKFRKIAFEIADENSGGRITGGYEKRLETLETKEAFGDIVAEKVCLTQDNGGDDGPRTENLLLFSRSFELPPNDKDRKEAMRFRCSAGFFLGEDGTLCGKIVPAYCFFPTKVSTGLNFIIHAPFRLAKNREGIQAGDADNEAMVKTLAKLAADAVVCMEEIGRQGDAGQEIGRLIDDSIFTNGIIPYDPNNFNKGDQNNQISFLPFYDEIKKAFLENEILPAENGYAASANAYWAAVPRLTELFSDDQLEALCGNKAARWVFPSINPSSIDYWLRTYIRDLVKGKTYSETELIQNINPGFLEKRFKENQDWLHKFYKWLSDSVDRTKSARTRPFFLDQDGNAVAAFVEEKQTMRPILFLPKEGISGYTVVNQVLLDNDDTKKFILEKIGLKKPSVLDDFREHDYPQYQNGAEIKYEDHARHFTRLLQCCCDGEDIDSVKDCKFLTYYTLDGKRGRDAASSMYLPTDFLKRYFESKPTTRFVDLGYYEKLVEDLENTKKDKLKSFLTKALGVKTEPSIIDKSPKTKTNYTGYVIYQETQSFIDGLLELIYTIVQKKDVSLSVFLWEALCSFADNNKLTQVLMKKILTRPDGRSNFTSRQEFSFTADVLKNGAWLATKDGSFNSAANITKDELPPEYPLDIPGAVYLLSILNIRDNTSHLTESQRKKIALADKLEEMGINESDLAEFQEFRRRREARHRFAGGSAPGVGPQTDEDDPDFDFDDLLDDQEDAPEGEGAAGGGQRRTPGSHTRDNDGRIETASGDDAWEEEETDQEEDTPPEVDYSERIKQARKKHAAEKKEIGRLKDLQELQEHVKTLQEDFKYSFDWFITLLKMESLKSGETDSDSRAVSISFEKVGFKEDTQRVLVLEHPNRYIPQTMEDLAEVPLKLHMDDGSNRKVYIEVANVRSSDTLLVKLKDGEDIDESTLNAVRAATINVQSTGFLLRNLLKKFAGLRAELNCDDAFNMQKNLCENIQFVFGPPGTGKTTYLARDVLLPRMRANDDCKILVLTPTNKAADVLTRRIMEISGNDLPYEDWLVRFGVTGDEEIERSPIFQEKTFDIRTAPKNVTITTIARFPYDRFKPNGPHLNELDWDYIVFDEASMIPLANIVYPLYKMKPRQFIIAGDPFQIEPITAVGLWQGENIYTMVNLNSFQEPKTTPHQYKDIKLLTTQYRSVPEIGDIFSYFKYDKKLNHVRTPESRRPLNIENSADIKAVNIIKFPVEKYEGVYRAKRLQHKSPYQIYSALFTYEYIRYLSREIAAANPESRFKIGVIAPYRAQADLIDKLLASEKLPDEVEVQAGTIHGFQGDECDIIFAVFNPPPAASRPNGISLNKENIINVAISRARDYLFIIIPDDISRFPHLARMVKLAESSSGCTVKDAADLEKLMGGLESSIESKTITTSHQSVNVYGLPEKRYEVRTEDNAVDIRIHREAQE